MNNNNQQAQNNPLANLNRNVNNSQEITKDTITGALDANVTLDLRLFSGEGRGDILEELGALPKNLALSAQGLFEDSELLSDQVKKVPVIGEIFHNLSPIEQLAHTFVEKDSRLYLINTKTGERIEINRADLTKNYAVNGIMTNLETAIENYLNNNPELTLRHNPSHGFVGDLLESGLGKLSIKLHIPEIIAMNRLVADDYNQRKDIKNAVNLHHSQGTIIGAGAMMLYNNKYGENGWENNPNQINNTQRFAAVGPAVLREDWENGVKGLKLSFDKENDYRHDSLDPVRYLTSPSNAVNQVANLFGKENYNSPIYVPNLTDIPRGIYHSILHMESHDVKNKLYQQPLQLKIQ